MGAEQKHILMKNVIHSLGAAAMLGAVSLITPTVYGQAVQTTTTTTEPVSSIGTVSAFSPDVITVRGEAGSPIAYHYSKTTTYVDENGAPVSMDTVRSGLPVTVYYSGEGDNMVASKVVVRKTTTTTTHARD